MLTYDELARALDGLRLPAVVVDLGAFDKNRDRHDAVARAAGLPLRFATKSVRVTALLRRALEASEARGLMCFSVAEAAALSSLGFDDLFVAYPTLQREALERLLAMTETGKTVTLAVDSVEGIGKLAELAKERRVAPRIALCVDMSLSLGRGRLHIGVRRSPLHTESDVVALAERARDAGLIVHGVMGYEAQVAGLGDDSPFDGFLARQAKGALRRVSMRELGARRARIVQALEARGFSLGFVNGGGTGSLTETSRSTGVTEVTAGSGLLKPLLFDGYSSAFVRSLEPACFVALEAVRRPAPRFVTCFGGGYVASGGAGPDKLPRPWLPRGLELTHTEGAGEVQTPLVGDAADRVELGKPVFFRHAKAGEPMERFREVVLVGAGGDVEVVPTYRGEGWCFG